MSQLLSAKLVQIKVATVDEWNRLTHKQGPKQFLPALHAKCGVVDHARGWVGSLSATEQHAVLPVFIDDSRLGFHGNT